LDERSPLAARAKPVLFESDDHQRGEEVVEERDVDVARLHTCHCPQLTGDTRWRIDLAGVIVVARQPDVMGSRRHRAGEDVGGPLPEVFRTLGGGHDHRHGAVGLDRAVEEPQRIRDHARSMMVGDRHRLAHHRSGIAQRMRAKRHRDLGILVVARPVLDAMAHADHRHFLERRNQPLRNVPGVQAGELGAELLPVAPALMLAGAVRGSPAARPRAIDEHRVRHPGRDRRGRDDEHGRRAAAAERRAGEEADRGLPERRVEVLLIGRLDVVANQAVDVARRQAGIRARGENCLDRHVELGSPERFGEGGLTDADDGGLVANRVAHRLPPVVAKRTVAVE